MRFIVILVLCLSSTLQAQWDSVSTIEKVYDTNIQTVQLRPHKLYSIDELPIINLTGGRLKLDFDDFYDGERNIEYTVIHCDKDWRASNLQKLDYSDGFYSEPIRDLNYSFQTIAQYIHYEAIFPNQNFNLKLSGNYLLVVFDADEQKLLFTKRFMVIDHQLKIQGEVVLGLGDIMGRKQEVRFNAIKPDGVVYDQETVFATVLQNRNWNISYHNIIPRMNTSDQFKFDYFGKIQFPAGNEFRFADLRNIRVTAPEIYSVNTFDNGIEVNLLPSERRVDYFFRKEANGDFVTDVEIRSTNLDAFNPSSVSFREAQFRGDYLDVFFSIKSQNLIEEDVYVYGGFSNFSLAPEYKMTYNEEDQQYEAWLYLKQGYYNYAFLTNHPDDPIGSWHRFEGNFPDTENNYYILLYYRPFGARYDQLIGYEVLSSK